MSGPFLSVVTRHIPARKWLLERLAASLNRQTDPDFEHVILVDEETRGLTWAEGQFDANKHRLKGDYVFIVDDDDYLIYDDLVQEAKKVVDKQHPDVIMVKMWRSPTAEVFPCPESWGKEPLECCIGSPCYLVRRELWQKYICVWAEKYSGDYYFIKYLFDIGCSFHWLDRIVVEVDRIGFSAAQE